MSKKNTKERLLDASAKLFAKRGFTSVSVNDICVLASANIAAVNYHFSNKQKLYDETLKYAFSQENHPWNDVSDIEKIPAEQRMFNFIKIHITQAFSPDEGSCFNKLLLRELVEKNISDISIIMKIIKPLKNCIEGFLRELTGKNASDDTILLLRYSLMSQCMMPMISPIAKGFLLQTSVSNITKHVYNTMMATIKEINIK